MDKTSDCCNHNILTSGGPCGTSGAHPTNTGAQSVLLRIPGQASGVWPIVPEVAPRGPGFARGAMNRLRQLPNLSILSICPFVCVCVCVCACVRACVHSPLKAADILDGVNHNLVGSEEVLEKLVLCFSSIIALLTDEAKEGNIERGVDETREILPVHVCVRCVCMCVCVCACVCEHIVHACACMFITTMVDNYFVKVAWPCIDNKKHV